MIILFSLITYISCRSYDHIVKLGNFYDHIFFIRDSIEQLEFFTGLEKLLARTQQDLEFESENQSLYKEHYTDLLRTLKQQDYELKQMRESISSFQSETFPQLVDKIKRIIIDKEKLIEGDLKEMTRLKQMQQQIDDMSKKHEDFAYLQQKITEVIDNQLNEELYRTMELIESKIMVGLFRGYQYEEIDIFMKGVDKIFREKNSFKNEDVVSLISIISGVVTELRLKLQNDQQSQQLDLLDKHLFYSQSKATHTYAKEFYIELLKKIENVYFPTWGQLEQLHKDSLLDDMSKSAEKSDQVGLIYINYLNALMQSIQEMLDRFLER